MSASQPAARECRFTPAEYAFLAVVILGWAVMVAVAGKDGAWDFKNYHWYIPYAFLNNRMAIDVAVAHQATYYNPFLDIPFYLVATHTHAWFALGVLGAAQGSNIVPLYAIMRALIATAEKRIVAAILSFLCMTGSLTIHLAGTTYYDNVMSVFVLTGLAVIITRREQLQRGSLARGALIAGLAGVAVGSAVGLKLPEAPFALGFAAALVILPGDVSHRATRLLAGGLGGVVGVALFAGYWMHKMALLTGNPLFPYFNQYFNSPLALHASYRDMRFLPKGLANQLLFPLLFSANWGVADDLPFWDIRVGIAYVVVIATLFILPFGRRPSTLLVSTDVAAALIVFAAVSYVAWLKVFAIYRYILLLEILAPMIIAACVALWPLPQRWRYVICAALLLTAVGTMRTSIAGRMPATDPYIQVSIPPIAEPEKSMILMTGETPMGYLAPSFPPQIPIVRIDGWMIQPTDGSKLTIETRKRVDAYTGDLYVVFNSFEAARNRDALELYGLAIDAPKCRNIISNLGGAYRFCPVVRIQSTHA
ncbi:MAG: hypothetical protein ABSD74_04045 [Rhizomicrobium sp.]